MSSTIAIIILGASLFLGLIGLGMFIWGLRNNQFNDENKLLSGALFDSEEDLNEFANKINKRSKK